MKSKNIHTVFHLLMTFLLWSLAAAVDSKVPDINTLPVPREGLKTSPEEDELWCKPEQVHLSCGDTATDMVVMWTTVAPCDTHVVFSDKPWNFSRKVEGQAMEIKGKEDRSQKYIHRVVLKNLLPSTTYFFRPVTSNSFGTKPMYFETLPAKNSTSKVTFLVSNDLNPESDKTFISSIVDEVSSGFVSAFIYNGDLDNKLIPTEGRKDSLFLSNLEQIVAYHPFMTVPARSSAVSASSNMNHYLYRTMFSMPNIPWPMPENKLWYSFDAGLIHVISYSTEVFMSYNASLAKAQQTWLVHDLTEANKRRASVPWIVAFGSDPMYCAYGNPEVDDCARNTSAVRHSLEDMFYVFGVDLVVESAHRCYERSWPKYKGVNTNLELSYNQPRAPVEVVMGLRNVQQQQQRENAESNSSTPEPPVWSAYHLQGIKGGSYGRLTVMNGTHLKWELLSAEEQDPLDAFVIVQETHGNFNLANLPHNVSHQINQTIIAQGGKPGTYDFIRNVTGNDGNFSGEGWSKYSVWLGLGAVAAVLAVVLGMVAIRSCVSRRSRRRRWREGDTRDGAGGGFYSVGSGTDSEDDDNDFEIDVYDKASKQSSKLLTSY
ncbi:purple acid phosphatase [Plakobranchus ocellatus]|uniref:Purple acid phosphatase n=1 Tax=Plakobranchus ocellatus TaxID=259542 RepID=A0AAV4BJR7_9GAST|nr:purple acid phosphatase [Plakobranchus ocellatus]